jgi:tyrosyl-tRNA synthetase
MSLLPLIPGTDGRKMGKSFDNTVDIRLTPEDMFGKVMSMSDDVMPLYFKVLTDIPLSDIADLKADLAAHRGNPMDAKKRLAGEIVAQFHSPTAAINAREYFDHVISGGNAPDIIPEHAMPLPAAILDVLVASGLASSKSEARRLVDGGGVSINGTRVTGYDAQVAPDSVIEKGRFYVRIVAQ